MSALVLELLLASAHSQVLAGSRVVSAADMWAFCSAAIVRRDEPPACMLPAEESRAAKA
jgi:hypothetical protein